MDIMAFHIIFAIFKPHQFIKFNKLCQTKIRRYQIKGSFFLTVIQSQAESTSISVPQQKILAGVPFC